MAGTGVQVMFAFLLVLPFYNRFSRLTSFERDAYFATLVCVAIATVLLIAPTVHHRLLFRHGEKEFIVWLGSRLAVLASVFLCAGFVGIFVLISQVVFGATAAAIVGASVAAFVGTLWFGVPLIRRFRS